MLGHITHNLGFYLPKEEDIPLRAWLEARKAAQGEQSANSSNSSSHGMM